MKMWIFAILLLGANASATEAGASKSDSKTLELPDFSNLPSAPTGTKDGFSFSADMNCQTTDGQSFKASEAGFDTCMANQKSKQR
jgi:hypothetical protein